MSRSQFQSKRFILRHAWLNLWDERMTTGRINQVAIFCTLRFRLLVACYQLARSPCCLAIRPRQQVVKVAFLKSTSTFSRSSCKSHRMHGLTGSFVVFRGHFEQILHWLEQPVAWSWQPYTAVCSHQQIMSVFNNWLAKSRLVDELTDEWIYDTSSQSETVNQQNRSTPYTWYHVGSLDF